MSAMTQEEINVSLFDEVKKLQRQRDALLESLQALDRQMSGNEAYEHAWVNYPDKPNASPASLVREAIAENI
jgi:hypothetical protein